jgi:hypothetical protein
MPKPVELTPIVDLTAAPGTRPKRTRRPLYRDLLPPCQNACPAGEDVQGWLDLAQAGRYRAAFERLVADNPLPATHGRVCYHPCESACNRGSLDAPVSIHAVERFLGDLAAAEGWPLPAAAPATGKRVLVIGAGPSGLSAAYHLRRIGHAVTIHEAGPVAGGMLHFGIPAYRLPRTELAHEVARIETMGVSIVLNHKVQDVLAERDAGRFDAVFVAIGAQRSQHVDIFARDAGRVLEAVSLLREVSGGERPLLGRRVVVYGRAEIHAGLLWIAVLAGRIRGSLAASTGVESASELIKYLLVGADAVMSTSALLRHGPDHARVMLDELQRWGDARRFPSVTSMKGRLCDAINSPQAGGSRQAYTRIVQEGFSRH